MSVCCILVYRGLARDRQACSAVRRHLGCGHGVYYGTIRAVMARLGNLFRLQISDVLWSSIRFLLELVPRHSQSRALPIAVQHIARLHYAPCTHSRYTTNNIAATHSRRHHAYARDKKFGCELSQQYIAASTRAAPQTARSTTKTTQEDKKWPQTTSPKPRRRR